MTMAALTLAPLRPDGVAFIRDETEPGKPVVGVVAHTPRFGHDEKKTRKLGDAEVKHLAAFPQLRSLDLSGTEVSDAGKKGPQTIDENFTLSAHVDLSADRRFVFAKFLEKSLAIEGIEKVNVLVDEKGTEAVGEIVFTKEASSSQARYIPDGGSILLPLQYRPRAVRNKDRWLVAEITPRIYIEEEERERRGLPPK
jgi:hypothetical protein